MIDIKDIEFEIDILKSGDGNEDTYQQLANLLIIRDELRRESGRNEYSSVPNKTESKSRTSIGNGQIDKETALEWARDIKNIDGTTDAHWNFQQAETMQSKKHISAEPAHFFLAVNYVYALLYEKFKKSGISNIDTYIEFAEAIFLTDPETTEKKLAAFHEN